MEEMDEFKIPRELEEIAPPPESVTEDMHLLWALRRVSNTFGVTLFIPQIVGTAIALILALVSFLFRAFILGDRTAGFSLAFLQESNSVWANLANCLMYFSYMFLPFVLQSYFLKENPFRIVPVRVPKKPGTILPALAVVLAATGLAAFAVSYIEGFLGFLGLQASSPEGLTLPQSGPAQVVYVLQICVLAPLCEEFIFRGMILQNLRRFGNGFAVVMSAILFGMVHGDLPQMVLAFLLGLVFGVLVIETDSIWVTIGMHAVVNTLSVGTDALSSQVGSNNAQAFYYVVVILAMVACVWFFVDHRDRIDWRERASRYWKAAFPASFAIKRFFLTPGTMAFTAVTVLLAVFYMKVV